MVKIGLIARADYGGLAVESLEFYENMPVSKVMVVQIGMHSVNLARFPEATVSYGIPSDKLCEEFLQGLDMVFCLETPYNWRMFKIARQMKVKTVLRINYEWLPNPIPVKPDLMISPSLWNYRYLQEPKAYLPFPINRKKLPFQLRTKAKTFLHIAGNGCASWDRNGTQTFLDSVQYIKSDIKIIIKSQAGVGFSRDERVTIIKNNTENYWDYPEADVLVMPRRYAGQSLPLNEAMSKGMAVIASDMHPQNGFLPKKLLIPAIKREIIGIERNFEMGTFSPRELAEKIDEIANTDIIKYSKISNEIAEAWSWETLRPKYLKLFETLCH